MTTTIKVTSHNHPALVQTFDLLSSAENEGKPAETKMTGQDIVRPGDGERLFYCTTTRHLVITDLEYDDPRVTSLRTDLS